MDVANDLTEMLNSAMLVIDNSNISEETAYAAEDCIKSLLKSMAVLGFEKVKENGHNG